MNTDTGRGMSELKSYIETIRNLQLETGQKQAISGDPAAGLLKIECAVKFWIQLGMK